MEDKIYYVYVYCDIRKKGEYIYGKKYKFEYEPIYIGKGKNGRAYDHLKKSSNILLEQIINKMKEENTSPLVLIYKSNLTESKAYYLERKMTEKIGLKYNNTGPLYNKRVGGCGGCIYPVTEETRKKISEATRGKKRTDECKQKMRERMKNLPDELRKNLSVKSKRYYILNDNHPFKMYNKEKMEERKEKVRKAKLLYETGMNIKEIALVLDCYYGTIWDYLHT